MALDSYSDRLSKEFLKLLTGKIDHHRDIACGGALPDFPAYKHETGILAGLASAKDLLEEAITNIQKGT